jgi:hypothetical protein
MAAILIGALAGAALGGFGGWALGGLAGAALGGLTGGAVGGLVGGALSGPGYPQYYPTNGFAYSPSYYTYPRAYAFPRPAFGVPVLGYWQIY